VTVSPHHYIPFFFGEICETQGMLITMLEDITDISP
jgi:hypothetical protein